MKPRSRKRPKAFVARRVLGETSTLIKNKSFVQMKLSDILESLPMTIDQEDIHVSAEISGRHLILTAFCYEKISPTGLEGGEYIVEGDDTDQDEDKE